MESHSISSQLLKSTSGAYRVVKSCFVAPFHWVQVGPQIDISLVSPRNYIILFFLRLKLFTSIGEMNSSRWQRFHEIPLKKFPKKQEGLFALNQSNALSPVKNLLIEKPSPLALNLFPR